ncbi:MAG: DUF167 domain-containing protein [bacterium]
MKIKVYPGSPKDCIRGIDGDVIKVSIKERAVEGRANRSLLSFLSEILDVPKSCITIKNGLMSKNKVIEVEGASENCLKKIYLFTENSKK